MPFNRFDHEREFLARLDAAWKRGAAQYGDVSFDKPLARTGEEILSELIDVAGWSFIAFARIRHQLEWIERSAENLGLSAGPVVNTSDEDGA